MDDGADDVGSDDDDEDVVGGKRSDCGFDGLFDVVGRYEIEEGTDDVDGFPVAGDDGSDIVGEDEGIVDENVDGVKVFF